MTGTQTLLARATLGAAGALAGIGLTRWHRPRALPPLTFDKAVLVAFAITRLGLFAVVFLALHLEPRGDIPGFYFPQAVQALQHHLPYRDFASSYAPLHPYLDALFISIRRTPLAIIFASVLGEIAQFWLWMHLGRRLFEDSSVRVASLLYLTSPISLQFVTVDGQDNVLISLMLVAALLLAVRGRSFRSGAVVGLAAAGVKFLPLLFAPAFFLALPRRLRWAAGAALVLALVYGSALLLRLPVLQPVTAEGAMRSAGNLPYLVEAVGGFIVPARLSDGLLLLVLAGLFALIGRACVNASLAQRVRVVVFGMGALTLALLLFSKKSWPPYLMLCLFPLCLAVSDVQPRRGWRVGLFALFGCVAVTEQSVWSSLLLEAPSLRFRTLLFTGSHPAQLLLALHLLLLAGYGLLLYESMRLIRAADA